MALGRHTQVARSANGEIMRALPVLVYISGTLTPAELWRDDAGTIRADNPVITDLATGNLTFVAEEGLYDLLVDVGAHRTIVEALPVVASGGGDDGGRPLPDGGTDGQVVKIVSGNPAWAADANTTYTAMSAAEATTGTATTARTISAAVLAGAVAERLPEAAYVVPASETFAADLVAALQAAGLMAPTP